MKSLFRKLIWICAIAALALPSRAALGDSLDVTYTYWGSSQDYYLDFTVSNNLTSIPTTDVFIFGVYLDQGSVVVPSGIPSGYLNDYGTWNNYEHGYGNHSRYPSPVTYNNNWDATRPLENLVTNQSLSGFIVHSTSTMAPTSVDWFALTVNVDAAPQAASYSGSDSGFFVASPLGVGDYTINGFEGTILTGTLRLIPEPTTFALTGLGGILFSVYAYRRRISGA
jgi:hypothetical protein